MKKRTVKKSLAFLLAVIFLFTGTAAADELEGGDLKTTEISADTATPSDGQIIREESEAALYDETELSETVDMDLSGENSLEEYLEQGFLEEASFPETDTVRENGKRLSGLNLQAYEQAAAAVKRIAEGEEFYTVLDLSLDVSDFEGSDWTAEDLGLDSLVVETDNGMTLAEDVHTVMTQKTGFDRKRILLSLLRDYPAEMYWFGLSYYFGVPYAAYTEEDGYHLRMTGDIQVYLSVSEDYSAMDPESGERIPYTVDADKSGRVNEALSNAVAITQEAADLSGDREKLEFYYQKVCSLSGYDYEAAAGGAYGDPWQIISVFDNDPETKVVCEGFSKAYQFLCDHTDFSGDDTGCLCAVGIQTWEGASLPDTSHMWNVVRLEGGNYLVDTTNGNGQAGLCLASCAKGNMTDGYYIRVETLNGKVVYYRYIYDEDTRLLYPEELLRLAGNETDPEPDEEPEPTETPSPTAAPKPTETAIPTPTPEPAETASVTPTPVLTPAAVKLSSVGLKREDQKVLVYNGKARKPSVIVKAKVNGKLKVLTKNKDYTVKYSSNKKPGTATITVKGRGNYTGTKKLSFKIVPKKTSLTSLKPRNRGFRAKWKKQSVQVTGYQIQYAQKKDFSDGRSFRVADPNRLAGTKKGLKKGKTYYVRIRTYKTVNGKNYYSGWSKVKKVKTK